MAAYMDPEQTPKTTRPVRPRTPQTNQPGAVPPTTVPDLTNPAGGPASGNTGVAGTQPNPGGTTPAPPGVPPVPPPALPPPPAAPPPTSGVGPFAVEANQEKLNSGHNSPMYQMLRTLSGFDPKLGLKQSGLEAALDALGLGDFTINDDDELSVTGDMWEGVTDWDVIKGFDSGDGVWVGQGLNGSAANIGKPGGGSGGGFTPIEGGGSRGGSLGMPDIQSLLAIFGDLGGEYGGPQGPGVFPDDNLQQVGQDPFSQLITGGLSGLIGSGGQGFSQTGQDVSSAIQGLLSGSGGGLNQDILNARMESAREGSERFRSSEMDFLESELSNRGLLNDGAMATAIGGLSQDIAGQHATALRDIFADESGRADDRFMGGLGAGVSMAQGNDRNLLEATSQGTERQNVLANIAMDSLNQNMDWQQFISTFGLSRDQLMNDIQMGRMDRVIELLNLFTQQAQIGAGGFV